MKKLIIAVLIVGSLLVVPSVHAAFSPAAVMIGFAALAQTTLLNRTLPVSLYPHINSYDQNGPSMGGGGGDIASSSNGYVAFAGGAGGGVPGFIVAGGNGGITEAYSLKRDNRGYWGVYLYDRYTPIFGGTLDECMAYIKRTVKP